MSELQTYELNGLTYKMTAEDAQRRGATPAKGRDAAANKARGPAANKTSDPASAD